MIVSPRVLATAVLAVVGTGSAIAGDTFISASVSGVLAPGVYGRIDLGNAPPPPVLNPQPVLVAPPVMGVRQPQPIYLYVPPGHAKHWDKHCREYNACGVPVYFANVDDRGRYVRGGGGRRDDDRGHGFEGDRGGPGFGRGGHGRGHGRD